MKFMEPTRKPKVIYWQLLEVWQVLRGIYPGIIVRQHHTDRKHMGLQKEQCAEWKKGHCGAVAVRSWWRMVGGFYWKLLVSAKTFKIYCLMGKHRTNSGSECPFDGPVIPFRASVEYHPISAKDLSRLHQFGGKVLPGIFLGFAFYVGRIW